jgi:transposase
MTNKNETPTSQEQTDAKAKVIKLGIDLHARKYVVVMQVDNEGAKSPQRFNPEGFYRWAAKLPGKAERVISCYEAGCFGYVPHRKLEALGIENVVVRPRKWDEYGSKVKTDGRDAAELCSNLDRYLAGNKKALSAVRVPTEQEERARSLSRQRDTLEKERKRLQNIGTSNGRYYGIEVASDWWKPKRFEALRSSLPEFLLAILEPFQQVLVEIDLQLRKATARQERTANRLLPVGLGAMTASVLDHEFVDYDRFNNRRQVASYTGLCPGEESSGNIRRQGSINKHGNPRIRHILLEAVWRFFHFQPDYDPIKKWKQRMCQQRFGPAMKKKMAVAIARTFAVDWWRIQTGRIRPEDVGLKVAYPSAYSTQAFREGRICKVYA